ncbi:MAG: 50S ribosomal protein L6 [Microgenomates group bacterium]|jgi:large subunit ribosomal protein L6|nr:50S ribosomal protein L6 [Candidatus Woesebacteria bacterium]MBP6882865.1 50S ribosomal protein L6 [Candidatus Woesebacteria bacterium]
MSKIGEKIIKVEPVVTVDIQSSSVLVKGPKGELKIEVPNTIKVIQENGVLTVGRTKDDKKTKSLHGLFRSLIANAVEGVQKPWEKKLEIVGTGFNVKMEGQNLALKTGFSHPVVFKARPGVTFSVEGTNLITISSVDKQLAGEVAYLVKLTRKPDPYKGKGIRYAGEYLKLKPGKKAKAAGAA